MNRLLDVIRDGFAKASIDAPSSPAARRRSTRVYKKMREKHFSFSQVFDIYGFRVIVPDTRRLLRGARRAARALQADPGQVQGLHRDPEGQRLPVAAHDAGRPVRHAARGRRSARTTCTGSPKRAWPRTGSTRRAASSISPRRSARRTAGCRACSTSRRSRATRRNSSSTSRSTCSPTRSTCSRRRARSWRCRAARPRSTSPTPCTPTSATTASPRGSTTSCCRCAPS